MTLTTEVKNLYEKNFKSLMKEIEENIEQCKNLPFSQVGRMNIVKLAILQNAIYRFNAIPIKIPTQLFSVPERTIFNFKWKKQKSRIAKTILNNKRTPVFKSKRRLAQSNKKYIVLVYKQTGSSKEQNLRPEINLYIHSQPSTGF